MIIQCKHKYIYPHIQLCYSTRVASDYYAVYLSVCQDYFQLGINNLIADLGLANIELVLTMYTNTVYCFIAEMYDVCVVSEAATVVY